MYCAIQNQLLCLNYEDMLLSLERNGLESVDSLCRDGTDAPIMYYILKPAKTFSF